MNLTKLTEPQPCAIERLIADDLVPCGKAAHWSVDGTPVCDEDMLRMSGMNSDNEQFFAPALTDLRARHLKIGAGVRIQMGAETGNLGVVYNCAPGRPAQWHVRPDGWPSDVPGIAYQADELDVLL